jgi:two-component system OmpR family sensor kinase
MTLRRRLVALMVVLVAVGLGAFGIVSYSLYSHAQYQALDRQLNGAAPFFASVTRERANGTNLRDEHAPEPGRGGGRGTALPPGSYAELRSPAGTVLTADGAGTLLCSGSCAKPVLPSVLTPGTNPAGRLLTVPSTDGSSSFRVLVRYADDAGGPPPSGGTPPAATPTGAPAAQAVPSTAGDVLVAAIPLGTVTSSLHRLVITDLAVGGAVLVLVSVSGLIVVRRGLRPLERMTGTARAIAGGDLSQRARPADGRGEVGQLGAAFNTMMGNIQEAFSQRDATEGRLRQFLADVSHELRTPLTSIRGYAELYRMGAATSPADLEQVMDRIETHAVEMGGLVEELLLLARLDQRRPPERVDVDLSELAAECCADLAVTAPERDVTLDSPGPVRVVADPAHLRQAIGNLLSNAHRHTPAGGPVEVSVGTDGGVATVVVRDHGRGLPEEGLTHAFDRFWRADVSRHSTGFGLGLSIVAAIASEHGGSAQVRNAPDGGAEFTLRLPAPAEPGDRTGVPAGDAGGGAPEAPSQEPFRTDPARSEEVRSH